jgi:hypothetical protein
MSILTKAKLGGASNNNNSRNYSNNRNINNNEKNNDPMVMQVSCLIGRTQQTDMVGI